MPCSKFFADNFEQVLALTTCNCTFKFDSKKSIDVANWGLFDTFILNLPVDKLARGYSPGGLETISDIKKVNFKGIQHIILVFIVFVVNFEYCYLDYSISLFSL